MTVSKFISGDRTYIDKAAEYLEARGLNIQQLPIEPYKNVDLGFFTKRKGGSDLYEPLVLEGWAFKVRGPDGEYYEDRWLLRVCNWPNEQIYQRRGGRICIVNGTPPKFVQISPKGADCTNFLSTTEELCHGKVVMFHEKFTAAALARQALGIPTLALSGCTNWSENGKPKENIKRIIEGIEPSATIVVCFDGDLIENPNVMYAAAQLKGWVHSMRKDIKVVFPIVPPLPAGKNGWDDWAILQGEHLSANWSELMAGDGVKVVPGLPIQHLIQEYQVKTKMIKDRLVIEHTAANYARLMRHPHWASYARDTMGGVYNRDNLLAGRMTMDDLYRDYEMWLADTIFQGDGASVRSTQVKEAVRMTMANRRESIALYALSTLPEVSRDAAYDAARVLITDGIEVTGPMGQEETVETIVRVYRDMVAMWDDSDKVDAQWALVLIGPSGCGKSNFPKSIIKPLEELGYETWTGQLAKEGNRANIDELMRQCRDCHVGVFDEYNPDDKNARIVEQNLFTLSTTRRFSQRRLHEEDSSGQFRHASVFLTTVDKNEKFIRSTKGAGERRFIILKVKGVQEYGGMLSSNRQVVVDCSRVLLRYGLQLYLSGQMAGDATEFTKNKTDSFISESPVEARISQYWARQDLGHVLTRFRDQQLRKSTGDIRWSPTQMYELLAPAGQHLSRQDRVDITNIVMECGAIDYGKNRVNAPGGEVLKDKVYGVEIPQWDDFYASMRSRFG